MTVIGIRQLRQNASAYLRLVQAGETLQIESRGRPVALWVPIPNGGAVQRLTAGARLSPTEGDVLDLGSPLQSASRRQLPSKALARARAHER